MNRKHQHSSTAGYYAIRITSTSPPLLDSNSERSFIMTQLQDMFSFQLAEMRSPRHHSHYNCSLEADLLAFSVTRFSIVLLIFCTSETVPVVLTNSLVEGLEWYIGEYTFGRRIPLQPTISINKLRGPHHALEYSIAIHLAHEDWEYDRYSSIGFYLHDRRGSWMRLWRLSYLYEQSAVQYRRYVTAIYKRTINGPGETSLHA